MHNNFEQIPFRQGTLEQIYTKLLKRRYYSKPESADHLDLFAIICPTGGIHSFPMERYFLDQSFVI